MFDMDEIGLQIGHSKKKKISEENVKSLSNFVSKFCDEEIGHEFHFFSVNFIFSNG